MKINFEWQNNISEKNVNRSNHREEQKSISSVISSDYSENIIGHTVSLGLNSISELMDQPIKAKDYIMLQRNQMTVMSNSMSLKDFHKMKEEGFSASAMDPEEIVTILDTIKAELAKSGTHIVGYTDTLSTDTITEITGDSGYAHAIAKELERADAPVTEENIRQIDEVVDQAVTLKKPEEGNIAYLVAKQMDPTVSNLYKAGRSSVFFSSQKDLSGFSSGEYSKTGMNYSSVRKTSVSKNEMDKMENQIKEIIEKAGLPVTQDSVGNGKWLVEKGLPVTEENLKLLQEIKQIDFPLDITNIIKQSAIAIAEGKSPFNIKLNQKPESIYEKAADLLERFQSISNKAADQVGNENKILNLINLEKCDISLEVKRENIEARRTLEQVRLKMTVETNIRLLRSGYAIDTAPMEELISELDKAAAEWEKSLFGSENIQGKADGYRKSLDTIKKLPHLPIATIGKISFSTDFTIKNIVEEGQTLKLQYEAVKENYETIMTAPRPDMGDSIKKAFRNVDDILKDMGLEISEANQRAIRIMGYNQITITEEHLEKVKAADEKVRMVIDKMRPAMTLQMIRDGKNPLEMNMEEIQDYISSKENNFSETAEKYSEFLYKLEKKDQITETERKAYIGIYRMIRQIEKSDGAVIGSLLAQERGITFSNLLSAIRSKKARGTDIKIDDSVGFVDQLVEKGISISQQINSMKEIENDVSLTYSYEKEQLSEIQNIIKSTSKEKGYLEHYHQPITAEGLQSIGLLMKKRGQAFSKVVEYQEDAEENILDSAKEFINALEEKETRKKKYDKLIEKSKKVMEESFEKRDFSRLDLKELQSVYKQLSVAHSLSQEENYEIPLKVGDEITSINLKVVHNKSQYGNVKITMNTEKTGALEARFVITEDGLEGSVLTDYMDNKSRLEKGYQNLKEAIEEALKESKIELKGLFFGVNEKLDLNIPEAGERNSGKDLSLLYKVAKNFIRYISQEEYQEEIPGGRV